MTESGRRSTDHHFVDVGEAWPQWVEVGFSNTLSTDADIAWFLLQWYKCSQESSDRYSLCSNCRQPLIRLCINCNNVNLPSVAETVLVCDTGRPALNTHEKPCRVAVHRIDQEKIHSEKPEQAEKSSLHSEKSKPKKAKDKTLKVDFARKWSAAGLPRKLGAHASARVKERVTNFTKIQASKAVVPKESNSTRQRKQHKQYITSDKSTLTNLQAFAGQQGDSKVNQGNDLMFSNWKELDFIKTEDHEENLAVELKFSPKDGVSDSADDLGSSTGDLAHSWKSTNVKIIACTSDEDEILDVGDDRGMAPDGGQQVSIKNSQLQQKRQGKKQYECTVCQARYLRSDSLKMHMRSHSGYRPFICEVCGSDFSRSYCLAAHMVTHSGEKPFRCPQCSASFTQSGKLNIHMRKHSGYKPFLCSLCGASFAQSDRLRMHMQSHSGVKPYKCPDCSKDFSHPYSLKVHSRAHTGHQPYKCDICSMTFADPSYFRRHKAKHLSTAASPNCESTIEVLAEDRTSVDSQASSAELDGRACVQSMPTLDVSSLLKETDLGLKEAAYLSTKNGRSLSACQTGAINNNSFPFSGITGRGFCESDDAADYHKPFANGEEACFSDKSDIYSPSVTDRDFVPTIQSAMLKATPSETDHIEAPESTYGGLCVSTTASSLSDAYDILNASMFNDSFSVSSSLFNIPAFSTSSVPASSGAAVTVPSLSEIRVQQLTAVSSEVPDNVSLMNISGAGLSLSNNTSNQEMCMSFSLSMGSNTVEASEEANTAALATDSFPFF